MLGAIAGDVIGSVYESRRTKNVHFAPLIHPFARFTDDTILTAAVAECVLHGGSYADAFLRYYAAYPRAGYGGMFHRWARNPRREPYNSFGNGSAMRVSPVAYAHSSLSRVLAEAKRSAEVTHNHPEGIRGAQATAAAVFLARQRAEKSEIRAYVEREFAYDLRTPWQELRRWYSFDVTCQGSVPESMIAFFKSRSYEDAVRKAVALGGDADTMAAIAGSVAAAYYGGVPEPIAIEVLARLDEPLRALVLEFHGRFGA